MQNKQKHANVTIVIMIMKVKRTRLRKGCGETIIKKMLSKPKIFLPASSFAILLAPWVRLGYFQQAIEKNIMLQRKNCLDFFSASKKTAF